MDAVNELGVHQIVVRSSSQVGKTEWINNIVGYFIDQDPAPMLLLQPTLEMGMAWSKDRLSSMLRDTTCLQNKIKDPRSRDSGNRILHKVFSGGHLTIAGSNSPASLASRPIRICLCDEIDRYPSSAGTEGDPINLALKRSTTFWNRISFLASTPTIKGTSRIDAAYEESDQRIFKVPCSHCGHEQELKWGQVVWDKNKVKGKKTKQHYPETARYCCESCGTLWQEAERHQAVKKGKWYATKSFNGIAGFHLNELYSPWIKLEDTVRNFLSDRKSPDTLKTWVNTALGESFEEEGEIVESDDLFSCREEWGDEAPEDVVIATAGVDVQVDRLEIEVVGWCPGETSYSLDYRVFYGNPAETKVWEQLYKYINRPIKHKLGIELDIACTCVDSGGHHTQQVYDFVLGKHEEMIFAVKGIGGMARPLVGIPSKNNRLKVPLWPLGVDTAKELLCSRLKMVEPGPGFCHFPMKYDIEYFRQLTAEKRVTKYFKGSPRLEWHKMRARNEALDCRVYAHAALRIINVDLEELADDIQESVDPTPHQEEAQQQSGDWIQAPDNYLRR